MFHARLLGTYDLRLDNRSIEISSRPAQSLLAYLLLNPNQPIRREKLAGLIWPDSSESNARSNLRHALWRVRKSFGSSGDAYLHADDLTISFQLQSDDWVDVNVLDTHIQDDISTDALIEIVSVYGGELLPGFYEDWVSAERERLKTVFEGKMDALLDRLVAESRWEQTVEWGERWISLGFTPEHAFRAMMIAHAGLGDLGKAAAVYQRCVLALESDLGVKPSKQTREIYQRLMSGTLKDVLPQTKNKLAPRGYKLLDQIGEGSFGAVYRAFQPEVNREVAVKVILPQYANDPEFIRRFEAEAQVVARLEHPHIVPLYDYWREPDGAYLVMRYLRAGSLADLLECGPLDFERASALVEQIGAALATAHRQGIVHRDLKPANILLDESGNFYLSDFGIAKDIASQMQATLTGESLGTPLYMSPEQMLGEPVTPHSDIYSLGLVLYQALTGEPPYPDDSLAALIEKQLHEPLPLVTALRPEIPEEIDQVLQLATAKQPEGRFQDVIEVVEAFQSALSGKSHPFQPTWPEVVIENPYKGLRPFREADAEDFFGRDTMVECLLARLDSIESFGSGNGHAPGEGRFLAVVGPSGCGKSSLVKAGLIPALRRGGLPGSQNWFVIDFIPGAHPMEEMEAALLRVAVNPPESLLGQLNEDERGLLRAVRRILPSDETIELVLVIDQFEEVFTLVPEEERRARFLDSLINALEDPRTRLRVVITLRADFTGRPLQYLDFGELFRQGTEFVLPMTSEELEQAIAGPAKHAGLILEPGLSDRIIWEVRDQPGTLPLLQHALTELFERREGRRLTLAAYHASGGVLGALGQRAEELYSSLDKRGQELTRQMFLRLITLGEGVDDGSNAPDTRRRVLRAELEDLAIPTSNQKSILTEILDVFGRYRLLTFDRDPITHGPTVEVAHEALLREWGRFREWINESRADVRLQRLLANAASEWENANRDESFLLTGAHLAQYEGWSQTTSLTLTQLERDYLTSSIDLRAKEEAAESERQAREARLSQRIQRMLQVLVGVFLLAAIISGGLAIYSSRQRQAALRQVSIGLATQAQTELEGSYPERSVLLALEALEKYPYTWQAERALGQIVREFRLRHILTGHRDTVTDAAWSPDGTRLATTGNDGTLRIWDARTLEELLNISAHIAFEEGSPLGVRELAWSPDGRRIATAASDKTSKVWDVTSGREIITYYGHSDEVWGVTWSPDGTWVTSAGKDGSIRVWNGTSGVEKLALSAHSDGVRKVAWSPDGTHIASASEDGTAKIWYVETGEEQVLLSGHTSGLRSVAWSPEGIRLATAGEDGTVRVWDAITGDELSDIRMAGAVWQAAWSPDGSQLATTNATGLAQVWDFLPVTRFLRSRGAPWSRLILPGRQMENR
jgi:serine/threonine protein kinase/DNA-binding SARP family transcriptional activator/uncharacterized protein with WD repeat